jgi:hypothetical protein
MVREVGEIDTVWSALLVAFALNSAVTDRFWLPIEIVVDFAVEFATVSPDQRSKSWVLSGVAEMLRVAEPDTWLAEPEAVPPEPALTVK